MADLRDPLVFANDPALTFAQSFGILHTAEDTMRTLWKPWRAVALALALAGCGKEKTEAPAPETTQPAPGDSAGRMGMGGGMNMQGMSGTQMGMQMMGAMKGIEAMAGDSMARMMPMHHQMLQTMMAQMDRDRADAKALPDPQWTALVDSIQADMSQMSQMSADRMRTTMGAHHGRVTRMIEMHRTLMQGKEKPK